MGLLLSRAYKLIIRSQNGTNPGFLFSPAAAVSCTLKQVYMCEDTYEIADRPFLHFGRYLGLHKRASRTL